MRLLDTSTLTFCEVTDPWHTEYAILSHRWYTKELSFADMRDLENVDEDLHPSRDKLRDFCRVACDRGYKWAWIDTVCIDKTSSAELQESINSMWRWYQDCVVCFVFLSDVHEANIVEMVPRRPSKDRPFSNIAAQAFRSSEWFRRGWTLQELLAPRNAIFFNSRWEQIGTKSTLASELSKATGINSFYLVLPHHVYDASIATRMSWAARRRTTRWEDRAYSLLGLFDVNMPLLYGEGKKAFLRLQQEIIQRSDDESIFAWREPDFKFYDEWGLLAGSPDAFIDSGNFATFAGTGRLPYRMTNKGLKLRMPVLWSTRSSRNPDVTGRTLHPDGVSRIQDRDAQQTAVKSGAVDSLELVLNCGRNVQEGNRTTRHAVCIKLQLGARGWQRVDVRDLRTSPLSDYDLLELPDESIFVKQPGIHMS